MPLIPELGWERDVDLCEFEDNVVYRGNFRTGFKDTQKNPVSLKRKRKK